MGRSKRLHPLKNPIQLNLVKLIQKADDFVFLCQGVAQLLVSSFYRREKSLTIESAQGVASDTSTMDNTRH